MAIESLDESKLAFFETNIRPILIEHCYECHNSIDNAESELALDWSDGMRRGGSSGPLIDPNNASESRLLKVIRHEIAGLEMPSAGPKLSEQTIADFEKWIRDGAVDPRDQMPTEEMIQKAMSWDAKFERRKQWWSLQPIVDHEPPDLAEDWSNHPIDRFLREAQQSAGLSPAIDASPSTVLRRLHAILTGLPASVAERARFEAEFADDPERAVVDKIDELLASDAFGERWARHWMDWFRYAEGHGGQGDPTIENAFEYRDYLIRALNADIPYNQLVREHIAGDLLENPRVDRAAGINESIIGVAQYCFVEHGYFPVDPLDELVKFTDNQIDVVSKTILGLTVSCARCHDHKFDAISHRDYHALFGVFASSRPAQRPLGLRENFDQKRASLQNQQSTIKAGLKRQWLEEVGAAEAFAARLVGWLDQRTRGNAKSEKSEKKEQEQLETKSSEKPSTPKKLAITEFLHLWEGHRDHTDLASYWVDAKDRVEALRKEAIESNQAITSERWDFRTGVPSGWKVADGTFVASPAGELGFGTADQVEVVSVLPAGLSSHLFTTREHAALLSPDFVIPDGAIAFHWAGAGEAMLRLVPENFPQPGNLYKQFEIASDGKAHWFSQKANFWKERRGYFHLMTRRTASSQPRVPKGQSQPDAEGLRSWASLQEIRLLKSENDRIRDEQFSVTPLLNQNVPNDRDELVTAYANAIKEVLDRWLTPAFSDEDALLLTAALDAGLLSRKLVDFSIDVRNAFEQLHGIEESIPSTNRSAPGVIDTAGFDQPYYPRGNHKTPGERVPRGFLSVFSKDAEPGNGQIDIVGSSSTTPYNRLHLADDFTSLDNPLVRRVIVNRLWQRSFGYGLVTTTDNFGSTGDIPRLPKLLDHLASRIAEHGWSIKGMLRYILTSRSFRLSSAANEASDRSDPNNRLWTHAEVRRVDAELLRDQMLSLSGVLQNELFGESFAANAPPHLDRRRGVYVQVKRERRPNELFSVFDFPIPTTTRGTRDVTTTPAQSVTMLNSPYVWYLAAQRAKRMIEEASSESDHIRITNLMDEAFTRTADPLEVDELVRFLNAARTRDSEAKAWTSLVHLIFNMKEFIYLR